MASGGKEAHLKQVRLVYTASVPPVNAGMLSGRQGEWGRPKMR